MVLAMRKNSLMRILLCLFLLSFAPARAQFVWNEGDMTISAPLQTCKGQAQVFIEPLLLTGYSLQFSFEGDSVVPVDTVEQIQTCYAVPNPDTAFWINADHDSAKELVVVLFTTVPPCDSVRYYFRVLVFDDEENFCAGRPLAHRHELDFEYRSKDFHGVNPSILAEIRRRQKLK